MSVFDAVEHGYPFLPAPGTGFVFIGTGLLLVLAPGLMQRLLPSGVQDKARVIFSRIYLIGALFWTSVASVVTTTRYVDMRRALQIGRYAVVEAPCCGLCTDGQGGPCI